MARDGFSNSNYLNRAATVTAYPATVSVWYNIPDLTGTLWESIWAASDAAASLDMWQGFIDSIAGADNGKLGLWTVVAGAGSGIRTTNLAVADTWCHACFILTNATSRRAVNRGDWAASAVDATSKTLSGIINETLGVRVNSGGAGDSWPGRLAECATYTSALTQYDVEALAAGGKPTKFGSSLQSYRPILGDNSPEPDDFGSFPLSITGSLSKYTPHPTIVNIANFDATPLSGNSGANATAHTVNVPTAVAGRLQLVGFVNDGDATASVTTPASGWTQLFTQAVGTAARLTLFGHVADGTEGSTITVTTSASEGSAYVSGQIIDWYGTLATGVNVGTAATGTSANPNPPSLDPADWGAEPTLWISLYGWDGNVAHTTYPADFTGHQATNRWANTSGCGIAMAARIQNVASLDPGTATIGSEDWVANTIAVRAQSLTAAASYPLARTFNPVLFHL